jgi:hypothetical protein
MARTLRLYLRGGGRLQAKCFYYFFMAVVVITDEAKATARRALTFLVRIFVNDTIAITVWASFGFHVSTSAGGPAFGTPNRASG